MLFGRVYRPREIFKVNDSESEVFAKHPRGARLRRKVRPPKGVITLCSPRYVTPTCTSGRSGSFAGCRLVLSNVEGRRVSV